MQLIYFIKQSNPHNTLLQCSIEAIQHSRDKWSWEVMDFKPVQPQLNFSCSN